MVERFVCIQQLCITATGWNFYISKMSTFFIKKNVFIWSDNIAFSVLTLLVGWQEEHSACTNWVVRYWRGYLSAVKCKMIRIWSSWCHCHPIISCCSKIHNGLHFWYRLTQAELEKRPLNGCSSTIEVVASCHQPHKNESPSRWDMSQRL